MFNNYQSAYKHPNLNLISFWKNNNKKIPTPLTYNKLQYYRPINGILNGMDFNGFLCIIDPDFN